MPPDLPETVLEEQNNQPISLLTHGEHYWKAQVQKLTLELRIANSRSDQLYSHMKSIEAAADNRIAAFKRKCDEMIDKTKQQLKKERKKVKELEAKVVELEEHLADLRLLLEEAKEKNGRPLRYNDLYPGGVLSKHVNAFTFFPTVQQNDAFWSY